MVAFPQGATLSRWVRILRTMTQLNSPERIIVTTPMDRPIQVELVGGPTGQTIVEVRWYAVVDGCVAVRAAHPDGYWVLSPTSATQRERGLYPQASFVPDPSAAFATEVSRGPRPLVAS